MSVLNVIIGLVGAGIGAALALFFYIQSLKRARSTVSELIQNAKKESDSIIREARLEAKDEAIRIKQRAEEKAHNKIREVRELEKKLAKREFYIERKMEVADKKSEELDKRENNLRKQQSFVSQKENEIQKIIEMQNERLERIAGMSRKEAQDILMENLMETARSGISKKVKEMRDKTMAEATREAKKIIVSAIQRSAADHTAETTVSVVNLPNDNMKGRIIGREGRNIRHFESLTGVEIIVDDTPEAVVLSGFDPVRREIARVALEKLVLDGRIHPSRIEEMIKKATVEVEESIMHAAEEAIDEVNLPPFRPELMKIIGKKIPTKR